jgi:hypothetical protein
LLKPVWFVKAKIMDSKSQIKLWFLFETKFSWLGDLNHILSFSKTNFYNFLYRSTQLDALILD